MWLHAANIPYIHGFSTRNGGISPAPFNTLNLGGSDDDPENIAENRKRAFHELGLSEYELYTLKQVHGYHVCEALISQQEGDALVSNKPGSVISVMVADCYPVLFADDKAGVIGAAHCGWRGTLAGIASKTVNAMLRLGATAENIRVAIGQGISQKNFQVGEEVIEQFIQAGFPANVWKDRQLNLIECILFSLDKGGIKKNAAWVMNRCTYEPEFFSYRRDNGTTGRMMGVISLPGK